MSVCPARGWTASIRLKDNLVNISLSTLIDSLYIANESLATGPYDDW